MNKINFDKFVDLCEEYGVSFKSFTPYQHRFTLEGLATFDYYSTSSKINQVGTTTYIVVDIVKWFEEKFKLPNEK